MTTEGAFLDYSARKLIQLTERISACLDQLDERRLWVRGAESGNAVGNLVLHLQGNVRQWIGFGVGGKEDVRVRDAEFAAQGGAYSADLKQHLDQTIQEAVAVLRALPETRLMERISVQGYDVTVLEAIYHVVEHFSGHAGQVIFATKILTRQDLRFHEFINRGDPHSETTP